jgi:hypothetical protein
MTAARHMLLESLSGHLSLLGKVYPRKAATPVAKKARRYVRAILRNGNESHRKQRDSAVCDDYSAPSAAASR